MKDIIGWNYVIIEYAGSFQSVINISLAQVENLGQFAYAVCYKFQSFLIHDFADIDSYTANIRNYLLFLLEDGFFVLDGAGVR